MQVPVLPFYEYIKTIHPEPAKFVDAVQTLAPVMKKIYEEKLPQGCANVLTKGISGVVKEVHNPVYEAQVAIMQNTMKNVPDPNFFLTCLKTISNQAYKDAGCSYWSNSLACRIPGKTHEAIQTLMLSTFEYVVLSAVAPILGPVNFPSTLMKSVKRALNTSELTATEASYFENFLVLATASQFGYMGKAKVRLQNLVTFLMGFAKWSVTYSTIFSITYQHIPLVKTTVDFMIMKLLELIYHTLVAISTQGIKVPFQAIGILMKLSQLPRKAMITAFTQLFEMGIKAPGKAMEALKKTAEYAIIEKSKSKKDLVTITQKELDKLVGVKPVKPRRKTTKPRKT